jgi:hypothetical protein
MAKDLPELIQTITALHFESIHSPVIIESVPNTHLAKC